MSADAPSDELVRLRTILDTLTDIILMVRYDEDEDETVCVWCNRATLLATGLTREEIIGSPPRSLLRGADDLEDKTTRRRLLDIVRSEGFLQVERPMADPSMPEGTRFRIRVFSIDPGSDLFVMQTELLAGPR